MTTLKELRFVAGFQHQQKTDPQVEELQNLYVF